MFALPKAEGRVHNKETYTSIMTKSKKFVPGVGSYNPKIDCVSVPYSRKRL